MSTPAANTFSSEAGSIDTGIAEAERVTATVNSEDGIETELFTVTVTAQADLGSGEAAAPDAKPGGQAPPKFIRPNFDRMPVELKELKNWLLWGAVWNGSKWRCYGAGVGEDIASVDVDVNRWRATPCRS